MSQKFLYVNTDGDYEETPGAYESTDFINSSAGAGDAGKPIVLDAAGHIDATMINDADVDHGGLGGLGDDDHTQYLLADGTRDISAVIAYDASKTFTTDADLVDKKYVDDRIAGLAPKAGCDLATSAALPAYTAAGSGVGKTLSGDDTSALVLDGAGTSNGMRVLVKDENSGGAHVDHGIYDVTDNGGGVGGWILTRAEDADGSVAGEVQHGAYTFIEGGTTQADTGWICVTSDPITVDTTTIDWDQFSGPGTYTASYGVELAGSTNKDIRLNEVANGGLAISSGEAYVDVDDLNGDGLTTSGTLPLKNLAIDWATGFTIDSADDKAFKASDLASTTTNEGAALVGVEDASAYYTGTNLETVLNEIETQLGGATSTTYDFAEANVLTDNDAIYAALNKLDLKWGDLASVSSSEGATLVGVEDSGGYYATATVEAVLAELATQLGGDTSTTFNFTEANVLTDNDALYAALEKLDLKWGDLASVADGEGASLVAIEDDGGYTSQTNVEEALQEIYASLASGASQTYTVDTGGVTKGDLLFISGNDTVLDLDTAANEHGIGIAATTELAAASVVALGTGSILTGVLSGATAGTKYYWDGSAASTTIPSGGGAYVWLMGVAKNATDLTIKIDFIKKNSA